MSAGPRANGSEPGAPRHSFLPADEPAVLETRPSVLFVLVYRQGWWLVPPMLMVATHVVLRYLMDPDPAPRLPMLALGWVLAGLLMRILAWLSRQYLLTDRRAMVVAGLVSRVAGDIPLRNVQHTTVTQTALERVFGLGTIGIATAGSGGAAINWLMVPRPHAVLETIRRAVESAQRGGATGRREPVRVIGLAGGIGSGKSEVARILESLGAVVIDSDREAKAALDRPDVRAQIVAWWGPKVLREDGTIDRSAVAAIIFRDAAERLRLERLIHPIVRIRRADARRLAFERGAKVVVIDAPLLFEACVDEECDAVLFVDAPREQRLARITASRGWDEAELSRREAAQIPLELKRSRSDAVVRNTGSPAELRAEVERVFRALVSGR